MKNRNAGYVVISLLFLALAGCSHPTEPAATESWPGFAGLWVASVASIDEGAPGDALDAWTLRLSHEGDEVEGDLVRVPSVEGTPERYRVVGEVGPDDSEVEGGVFDSDGERVLSWRGIRDGDHLIVNTFGIYFEFLRSYGSGLEGYTPPGGDGFAVGAGS